MSTKPIAAITSLLLGLAVGAALIIFAFSGCSGQREYNVLTPYGEVTSGTVNLDLRPYLPAPQLEK